MFSDCVGNTRSSRLIVVASSENSEIIEYVFAAPCICCGVVQSFPDQEGKSDGTETTANLNQKLYFHRLGTDQSQDVLCAEWPENPNWMG